MQIRFKLTKHPVDYSEFSISVGLRPPLFIFSHFFTRDFSYKCQLLVGRSGFLARMRASHRLTEQWRTLHPIARSPREDGAVRTSGDRIEEAANGSREPRRQKVPWLDEFPRGAR